MADDAISSTATNGQSDEVDSLEDGPERKKLKVDSNCFENGDIVESSSACTSTTLATTSNGDLNDEPTSTVSLTVNQSFIDCLPTLKKLYAGESVDESDSNKFVGENCQIVREPFQIVQLKQFVQNNDTLKSLKKTISKANLNRKNNDLYSLKQSSDLSNYPEFASVCDFFRNDVRPFLQDLTETNLNSNVALTISKYDENDYLLCHDDQLDNRKIAFILYLVEEDWSENDGGQLELFQCKSDDYQPIEVVKRLNPEWNLFNFFIVQPFTYHQVSEVKTSRTPRWSINGWFHSDEVNVVPRNYTFPRISQIRPPISVQNKDSLSYKFLLSWINPHYIVDDIQNEIQESFVNKSEIQLNNFLRPEKYIQLANALKNKNVMELWKKHFSPVLANYEYIPEEFILSSPKENDPSTSQGSEASTSTDCLPKIPKIIREAFNLFNSEAFFLVVSNLTGIRLHELAILNEDDEDDVSDEAELQILPSSSTSRSKAASNSKGGQPKCRGEVRRWQAGNYTLASSVAPEYGEESAIDVMFFLNVATNSNDNNETEVILLDDEDDENEPKVSPSSSVTPKETVSSSNSNKKNVVEDDNKEIINLSDDDSDESDEEPDLIDIDSDASDPMDEEVERVGGYVSYIDESATYDLLSISPSSNCLNIVYRLKGTQRFMKYINSRNENVPFNELSFVYYQK